MDACQKDITKLLDDWTHGNREALDCLLPMVHSELLCLAHRYMRRENADHTLQTTALVNEAYLRLIDQRSANWENRAQFLGIAAQMIRRILLDHARKNHCVKRGDGAFQLPLEEAAYVSREPDHELIALDAALESLAEIDRRKSQVVELRFFGGLSVEETAAVLKVSPVTVMRDWNMAKAWLQREIRHAA